MRLRPLSALGLLLTGFLLALFSSDGTAACPPGAECPPCGPYYCIDVEAARAAKAAKKAAAIRRGLPERLARAFDEIADCVGCVEISPDWPHLVVEYDVEAMEKKFGPGHRWTSHSQPWSADEELRARNDMREGLVKSIHIVLARYPCRCCPSVMGERWAWVETGGATVERPWKETPGWNEALEIHQDAVIEEETDPNDLGPDPADLTNIPDSARRPPVDLEICGGPEVPPARHVHVSCEACRSIAEEHDKYADYIHDAQIRLRALRRGACVLVQVINGVWGEIRATEDLAQTPQTEAQQEALFDELSVRKEDLDRDRQKMKDLEAEIRDLEASRQAALARLAQCEELCRQAAQPPQEQVAVGQDPKPADETPPAGCADDECGVPPVCTGDDCDDVPSACTGCADDECGTCWVVENEPFYAAGSPSASPLPCQDSAAGPCTEIPPLTSMCDGGECHFVAADEAAGCTMGADGWTCDGRPVATYACDGGSCTLESLTGFECSVENGAGSCTGIDAELPVECTAGQCWSTVPATDPTVLNPEARPPMYLRGDPRYDPRYDDVEPPHDGKYLRGHPLYDDDPSDDDPNDPQPDTGIGCTGDTCGVPPACTGDECNVSAACTGDGCELAPGTSQPFYADGQYDPTGVCTGDTCDVTGVAVWDARTQPLKVSDAVIASISINSQAPTHFMFTGSEVLGVDLDITRDAQWVSSTPAFVTVANTRDGQIPGLRNLGTGDRIWVAQPAATGNLTGQGFRIAEDASPLPQDRFFLDYVYFNRVSNACPDVSGKVVGFEVQQEMGGLVGMSSTTLTDDECEDVVASLGRDRPFFALGQFSDGPEMDLTERATWSTSRQPVGTVPDSDRVPTNVDTPVEALTDALNPTWIQSLPLLPGLQDGGLELGSGVMVGVGAAPGGRLAGAMGPRAGRGADETAAFTDGPQIYLESLGGSTGEVFKVHIVNPDQEPLAIQGYAAIEPVQASPNQRQNLLEQVRRASGVHQDLKANFYCLQFLAQAPAAGTLYRVAGRAKQELFAPVARVLESARRLHQGGLLSPDTNPESYFHSIRQWAVWTIEKGFDQERFLDAFLQHARKNLEASGQPWSDAVADVVRRSAEGRWEDISKVLEGQAEGSTE